MKDPSVMPQLVIGLGKDIRFAQDELPCMRIERKGGELVEAVLKFRATWMRRLVELLDGGAGSKQDATRTKMSSVKELEGACR
jgi:hypothetical protein